MTFLARLAVTAVAAVLVMARVAGVAAASERANALTSLNGRSADTLSNSFAEISTRDATGVAIIQLAGIQPLPKAAFSVTEFTSPDISTHTLSVNSSAGDPFSLQGSSAFLLAPVVYGSDAQFTYSRVPRLLVVEATSSSAPKLRLFVGVDANNDGLPNISEVQCQSASAASGLARCVVDLAPALVTTPQLSNAWVLIDVPEGAAAASYDARLSVAVLHVDIGVGEGQAVNPYQTITGPGMLPALGEFSVRLSWHEPYLQRVGERRIGAIFADPATVTDLSATQGLTLGQALVMPFALTRNASTDDVPRVGAVNAQTTMLISPNESLQHNFIDVPPNASSLKVVAPAVRPFYLIRSDFPSPAASPAIAAAPASGASFQSASVTNGGQQLAMDRASGLSPGRWYVVMTADGVAEETFASFDSFLTYDAAAPMQPVGGYYNPARSGHGIFISRASGQQVVDWYTFLEDGTPTWYIAQNTAPQDTDGVWTSPLYRVWWHGDETSYAQVGFVVLTAVSPGKMIFSWNLEGAYGSEPFQLLAAGACTEVNGALVNLSGMWFAPAQSGYGIDILAAPSFQFFAFYLYDSIGVARWGVGQSGSFTTAVAVPFLQSTGFCPVCEYVPLTTQPLGIMDVNYATASTGQVTTNFLFHAPLSGTWGVAQPMARLTGDAGCEP